MNIVILCNYITIHKRIYIVSKGNDKNRIDDFVKLHKTPTEKKLNFVQNDDEEICENLLTKPGNGDIIKAQRLRDRSK